MDDAGRSVEALTSYLQMLKEFGEGDPSWKEHFFWKWCVTPVVELQTRELLKPFAYLISSRASELGANEWIAANRERVVELEQYLASQ